MTKRVSLPGGTGARARLLVVDDHPLLREGLRGVIDRETDLVVCGEAENAQQAMDAVAKLRPDLVLVDVGLPGKSGLELVRDLKAMHPRLKILAVSMHDEALYAERMLRAGAGGYIAKQQESSELLKATRQVLADKVYLSKQMSESLLRRFGQKQEAGSPTESLTDREFEVLRLLGKGVATKDISRQLHLSAKTVAVHGANIRKKLGLQTTAQLIRFAVQSES